jgi:mycothiol system anti-sigma-R factor
MTCQEVRSALNLYLDDELTALEASRVQEHLDLCGGCRETMETEASLHGLLAADAVGDEAPARLRERILEQVAKESPKRGAWLRRLVVSAALALLVCGVLLDSDTSGPPAVPLAIDAVAWHVASGRTIHDQELSTADPARLAGWMNRRLGMVPDFPASGVSGERLVGARVSLLATYRAAQLVYEGTAEPVSLFIIPRPFPPPPNTPERVVEGVDVYPAKLGGISVVWWNDGGHLYLAVARASEADAVAFAASCIRNSRTKHGTQGPRAARAGQTGSPGIIRARGSS